MLVISSPKELLLVHTYGCRIFIMRWNLKNLSYGTMGPTTRLRWKWQFWVLEYLQAGAVEGKLGALPPHPCSYSACGSRDTSSLNSSFVLAFLAWTGTRKPAALGEGGWSGGEEGAGASSWCPPKVSYWSYYIPRIHLLPFPPSAVLITRVISIVVLWGTEESAPFLCLNLGLMRSSELL